MENFALCRKLVMAQGKGGAGKTFFSLNLAVCFQKAGYKVLLVDADGQGTSNSWNADRSSRGLVGFDYIHMESEDLFTELDEHTVNYDICIIDTGGTYNDAINGIRAADYVLIPLESGMEGVRATQKFIPKISKVAIKLETPGGIIFNRWENTIFDKDMLEILEKEDWIKNKSTISIFETKIPKSVKAKMAYAQGMGVVEAFPNDTITKRFVKFYNELCEDLNVETKVSSNTRKSERTKKSKPEARA